VALFQFLAELMQRFGIALNLDPWYFTAVQAIGFLPADQIAAILRAYGHVVTGPVCGLTGMADDGQFNRSIPFVWIAEPSAECPVSQIRYFLLHELTHVTVWLRDGLTVWPGHH
jgi:hypothetical protein